MIGNLYHPGNLKYSTTDEWLRLEGDKAIIGITDYAQDQLGDIVYIELPWDAGDVIHDTKFGDLESVKATSELVSPVSGSILQVNHELQDHPEWINESPYDQGWLLVVKLSNPAEVDNLMSAGQYLRYLEGR